MRSWHRIAIATRLRMLAVQCRTRVLCVTHCCQTPTTIVSWCAIPSWSWFWPCQRFYVAYRSCLMIWINSLHFVVCGSNRPRTSRYSAHCCVDCSSGDKPLDASYWICSERFDNKSVVCRATVPPRCYHAYLCQSTKLDKFRFHIVEFILANALTHERHHACGDQRLLDHPLHLVMQQR
jgi:hypothetical protein